METLYVVMNTFSGRYLQERSNKNIGHENINFFSPSDCKIGEKGKDQHLLWLNCDGNFPKKWKKYDGNITLLMVTNFANAKDFFRVLAVAEQCHIVDGVTTTTQKEEAKKSRYKAFNDQFPYAKYGAKTLKEIFDENTYQGILDQENTLATFYTDPANVKVPSDINKTIRIKKDRSADIKQNMANEKMRMYIDDGNAAAVQELIDRIVWIPLAGSGRYPMQSADYEEKESLFSATGNEKDELSVSNMISFSLSKSSDLLQHLVERLTGTPCGAAAEYVIAREDKHVDLTVMLPDRTIIIENKIDSTIVEYPRSLDDFKNKVLSAFREYKPPKNPPKTGKSREKYNEMIEQYRWINEKVNQLLPDESEAKGFSQLTKYYIQSKISAELNGRENLPIHYFFLVPNYTVNKFRIDPDKKVLGSKYSNEYEVITYRELKAIFEQVPTYPYRDDILVEFEALSRDVDNKVQNRQIYTFLKKCGL